MCLPRRWLGLKSAAGRRVLPRSQRSIFAFTRVAKTANSGANRDEQKKSHTHLGWIQPETKATNARVREGAAPVSVAFHCGKVLIPVGPNTITDSIAVSPP